LWKAVGAVLSGGMTGKRGISPFARR